MLWAIDVGNTQTVVGVWDGAWRAVWRIATDSQRTEDELTSILEVLARRSGLTASAQGVVVASVVPGANDAWRRWAQDWSGNPPLFVSGAVAPGLRVAYDPPHAVGADRIANAIGALRLAEPPIVVVDFGTATTFDAIGPGPEYLGGAILPGILVSSQALFRKTAQLPQVQIAAPRAAIGRTTPEALQSGIVLGYAGAIEELTSRFIGELGGAATVIATGGLSEEFLPLCPSLARHEPTLTLDGLRYAWYDANSG